MRIGIMLRSIDESGGIGVYTQYLTKELLEIDSRNEYVLFYRSKASLGRFTAYENVTERLVRAPNKAVWDQIVIPLACLREKIDILFHPKFTVPILAPCKTAMVLHGAGWLMPEHSHFWNDLDLRYIRLMMPVYCRSASAVIAVSQITTDTFNKTFNIDDGKIRTIYFAPGTQFRRICDQAQLETVREKYGLPEHFVLHLTGYDRGPRKNIKGVLAAYKLYHPEAQHKLVIGGKGCHRFRDDFALDQESYGEDVVFPGWIAQEDLPAVYTLADLFLYPSWVEAFPIPVLEAMACGVPVITSRANGLQEIAGDAAFLVDPGNPQEIAAALDEVLGNTQLRQSLSEQGLARAQHFSWRTCAEETLKVLQGLV